MRSILLAIAVSVLTGCGPAPHTVKDGDKCSQDADCMAGSCCFCENCDAPALPPHQICAPLQNGVCPKAG